MKRIHIILILTITSLSVNSKNLPDSIVISLRKYVWNMNDTISPDSLLGTILSNTIKKPKDILFLTEELNKTDDENSLLSKFNIDTMYIKDNPEKLLKLYNKKLEIKWNKEQKEFIFKELSNPENYKKRLLSYLSLGNSYGMHIFYKHEYVFSFYKNGQIDKQYFSRRFSSRYAMPYTDNNNGNMNYNFTIEKYLNPKISKPMQGKKLLKYLVNEIIDDYSRTLYKLEPYSYLNEINELKTDFEIVGFEKMYGYGRYFWKSPSPIKIILKNDLMFPSVSINFLASQVGNSIYSRDFIKKDYKNIVEKVQSITFFMEYLKYNPDEKLDIYYYDNKCVNEYNIENVNKNPNEWKKQDNYIESLKWYEKNNITPSFDIAKAIKVSEQNHCGCNYRFERSFLEKAIFFELHNEKTKANSIWFLLPDNRVLLYLMQGEKVLNYDFSKFGENRGLQYPCILFDKNGKIIEKSRQ
ncbi:MAG: hypothetical protein LBH32_02295 [Dysgonamonadaceae bacterium]|jgi:hypothetical protein|nr:hypothetical protein [Dysgonamonadaceae bacterium]